MENNTYTQFEDVISEDAVCRDARRAFSRPHLAAGLYILIASATMILTEILLIIALGYERAFELLGSTYFIWIMQVVCMYVISFPVFLLLVRKLPRREREKKKMGLEEFVVTFLVCMGVMVVLNIVSTYFVEFLSAVLGYSIENDTSDLIMSTPIWVVILVAVIIGPIIEELMFRKVFIDVLGVYGDRIAIVFSAVAFGIFHGNFSQVLYATGIGLIFGYVYTKTSNILHTILLHIAINFMGSVPALLVNESADRLMNMDPEAELDFGASLTYTVDTMLVSGVAILQYAMAIAGIVLLVYLTASKAYKIPNSCDIVIPKERILTTSVCNFGVIFFLIFSLIQFTLSILPPAFLG